MSTVETSHGKPRPRPLRVGRVKPTSPAAALAAPFKDPATGRFVAGNPGGRLRQLAAIGKLEAESLLRLSTDAVAPWLRPHLTGAQDFVQQLVDALPARTAELLALAGDEAKARLMASAALAEGAREGADPKTAREWRDEARHWMREARQVVLTRKAIERETHPGAEPASPAGAALTSRPPWVADERPVRP